MRWLPLLLLVACETASTSSKPTTPRAKLDTHELPVPLPARGYAVQTFGIGGVYDLDIVDAETRTLRVIVHGPEPSDRTIQLDAAKVQELDAMADRAWHETQHGKMPDAMDIVQHLYIVDHDDAFHLRGSPIESEYGPTGRPEASKLVVAISKLAMPAAAPPQPSPSPSPTNTVPRKSLVTPDTDPAVLPKHGVVVHTWGMAGDTLIVIDRDASTMHVVENVMGKPKKDKTKKLDAKALEKVMTAAVAAMHEAPTGPMPTATDIREDLIILDGDDAFYLTGRPISRLADDEATGRPSAATVMRIVYEAARR